MLQETCLAGEWSEHSGAGHVHLCVTEKSTQEYRAGQIALGDSKEVWARKTNQVVTGL